MTVIGPGVVVRLPFRGAPECLATVSREDRPPNRAEDNLARSEPSDLHLDASSSSPTTRTITHGFVRLLAS